MRLALDEMHQFAERPLGSIRIHAWRLGWEDHVEPILPRFRQAFPDVVLDICIDDSIIDLVAAHYDIGIRLGSRIDQDMVTVRLGPNLRQIGVASPQYIARHGRPKTPRDLSSHSCLRWRWAGETIHTNGVSRTARNRSMSKRRGGSS
ncbi:MAG: LysR substrate-binding domain-containing protein [Acetobacteraceae bacterium]